MPGTAHGARPHGVWAHGADPTHAVHLLEAVATVAGLAIVAGGAILSAVRRPGRRA
ncbi:MAG TPA: hypothetical protein VH257_24590 [Chloroflexota bacterium]|jgi:hypothetical protein|nr:hypothetical protein [Chloroflexota bacterium]